MKPRFAVFTIWMLFLAVLLPGAWAFQAQSSMSGGQAGTSASGQLAPSQPAQPAQAAQPATTQAEAVSEGPAPLRVMVGKSLLINTADRLKRVSVTDPNVADAVVVTPTQVLVHGRTPGEVSLMLWDESERSRSFDLRVDIDVTSAAEEMKHVFPEERVNVTALRNALVLSGHVVDEATAKRAGLLAEAYSKNVVNVLTFGPVGAQQVLLEVKFAEVDRVALAQWGVNLYSTGAANSFGIGTTGQFGGQGPVNLDAVSPSKPPFTSQLTQVSPLNIFIWNPNSNIAAAIQALKNKNLLQILAEPNLVAVNGKEASFLAGGEFPVPVPQSGSSSGVITIQYKEFGVRLNFTPVIQPNGNIHMVVKPEVSQLDFADGLRIQGFVVPALTTRRASTEIELQNGQSFVIAGLIDNRLTDNVNKVPGLGDIPILGQLFRSKSIQKNKTELLVLVTAHLTAPTNQPTPPPNMPQKFMDEKSFDGTKSGSAGGNTK